MSERRVSTLPKGNNRAILQAYRMPLGVEAALVYLTDLNESVRLLSLYRHFFPVEFAASTARSTTLGDEVYSPKEEEFLNLCSDNLFPLPLHYYFDLSKLNDEERLPGIEIVELGISYWEEDLEWLGYGWKLLCILLDVFSFDVMERGRIETFPAVIAAPGGLAELHQLVETVKPLRDYSAGYDGVSIAHLESLCTAVRAEMEQKANIYATNEAEMGTATKKALVLQAAQAIGALPLALRILYKDTGLVFLDISAEMPADGFLWTVDDVEYLTEAYRQTAQILKEVEVLLNWLADDRYALINFKEVIKIWNSLTTN